MNQITRFDPVRSIIDFNRAAGNTTATINVRQSALYAGLQVEELAEKMQAIGLTGIADAMDAVATSLKKGDYDATVGAALMDPARREGMLDADCDLFAVSVGAAISQGADFPAAIREVCASNDSKRNAAGALDRDANGKIIKGANYFVADLAPFIGKDGAK